MPLQCNSAAFIQASTKERSHGVWWSGGQTIRRGCSKASEHERGRRGGLHMAMRICTYRMHSRIQSFTSEWCLQRLEAKEQEYIQLNISLNRCCYLKWLAGVAKNEQSIQSKMDWLQKQSKSRTTTFLIEGDNLLRALWRCAPSPPWSSSPPLPPSSPLLRWVSAHLRRRNKM